MQNSTINCSKCGYANDFGIRFCINCGNNFQYTCPICNNLVEPHSKFCNNCGSELVWQSQTVEQTNDNTSQKEQTDLLKSPNNVEIIRDTKSKGKQKGNYLIFIVIVIIIVVLIAAIFIIDTFLK